MALTFFVILTIVTGIRVRNENAGCDYVGSQLDIKEKEISMSVQTKKRAGKVPVVTGASKAIGASIAKYLIL